MELTKPQIQLVEDYLASKNFDFIDLKIEVLDHIISDIENLIENNFTFENAFKTTILKWDKNFKETSSFYFGLQYYDSKIVVKKAVKQFKKFYLVYLLVYFLPLLFLKFIPISVSGSFANFTNGFLLSFTTVLLGYMVYIFFKIKEYKVKTSYSFIIRTQYLGLILPIIGVYVGSIFDKNGEMNPVFSGFVFAGFTVVFIIHHFYKKHLCAINKFKVI